MNGTIVTLKLLGISWLLLEPCSDIHRANAISRCPAEPPCSSYAPVTQNWEPHVTQSRVHKPETGRQRVKSRSTKVRNCHVSVQITKWSNEWFTRAKGSFLLYFYFYPNKLWRYQLLLDKNNVVLLAVISTIFHWTFLQSILLRPTAAYSLPQEPPSPAFLAPERSFQAGFIVDNLMAGNSEFKMA